MKILLVTEKYPPTVGGGETHVHQLAEGLATLGNKVVVVTEAVAPGPPSQKYRDGEVEIHEVEGLRAACQRLDCMRAVAALHAEFSNTDADIVHVFSYVPALLTSWLRPSVTAKLVVSLLETFVPGDRVFDMYFHKLANYEVERALQRGLVQNLRPDLHICGSQAYLRWAREGGFVEPAVVVGFGTDLAAFTGDSGLRAAWRAMHGFHDEFLFLVPARPVRLKRIEDAIAALQRLRGSHRDARLVLTAPTDRCDEEYMEELRALADRLKVANLVHWVTGLTWQDMPALYAACDAVILPSTREGWGIALNEAMASRRPVITTDVEAQNEVIENDRTGWLYPVGDHAELAMAMQRVMTEDQAELVERARQQAVDQFSASAMAQGHARAYQSLLANTRQERVLVVDQAPHSHEATANG